MTLDASGKRMTRAVGMCQSIRVKVRLLNGDAYEKKQGADDDRQEMSA